MRFSDEAKCHICKRIFCCGKCRHKHQIETHAIAVTQPLTQPTTVDSDPPSEMAARTTTIYVFCPICEQKPLALHDKMYAELLAHIESVHLPLRCRKCLRQYTKIDDLKEFSKCVDLGQSCSIADSAQNLTSDTDASKVTVKKAVVAANTISTQTSPCMAKDINETQHHLHLTPISLFNLRWKAKSRLAQEEFISDSVSSIRNLSTDSANSSAQQRQSIGQASLLPDTARRDKGKVIRSTSTPLQVYTVFAKPKETLTFNASTVGGGHMSSIYHSGCVPDEQNSAPPIASDSNQFPPPPPQQQHRTWKAPGRGKMSAVTPLRQVMSRSIQKAFVEHGVSMLANQGDQRRMRLDLNENGSPGAGAPLDLRLSPVVRRTQSEASMECNRKHSSTGSEPYQILLSAQKLTTESIIITRTQHGSRSVALPAASASASSTSTVYNSCESVEIITSSTSTAELSANVRQVSGNCNMAVPPITPITRIPGAIINKKLIIFETPQKGEIQSIDTTESKRDDKEIFYTPNPSPMPPSESTSPASEPSKNERRRQQIVPRQLSGQFSPQAKLPQLPRPQGPRARPPLRVCHNQRSFSCVQDIGSEDEDEVFRPNSASTHNDKKRLSEATKPEAGRLWSLMSSVIRLPKALRTDRDAGSGDKENTKSTSGSLIRRCASIAGSLVRTMQSYDDADLQSLKRKRTQTLDNAYCHPSSPSNSSKRLRIQPRKPIDRMRNN